MAQENEVLAALEAHVAARVSGDVDAVMESYSEAWTDDKGFTKRSFHEGHLSFTQGASGDDIEVDLSQTKIVMKGEEATCSPVTIYTVKGSITYGYRLRQEADGIWRFIYSQTEDWEPFPMDKKTGALKRQIDDTALLVREHREGLLADPLRPGYHFVIPEGLAMPFDPNGAIFWQGRYHLFYIFQDKRSGKKADHWGHVSSTDLFHWRHHPTGLLEGMYSGNCFINADGVPTMCYHQVNQGNAMAIALDDDLEQWHKLEGNPITPVTQEGDEHHEKYRSWDPFGWLEGDTYYAIFGGKHPGIAKSQKLDADWQYVGDLFAHGVEGVPLDEDVSCAELFKLGDKDMLLCISHRMGCRYYLGEWKNEQFYPESHGQMSWVDKAFFAPESLEDDQGRRIMWAWLMDSPEFGVHVEQGWSGSLSLPRVMSLDEQGRLCLDVVKEIEALRYRPFKQEAIEVPAGQEVVIDQIKSNSLELAIDMDGAEAFGLKVCRSPDGEEQTVIAYDAALGQLKVDTHKSGPENTAKAVETAPFSLAQGERLQLRVFVDKSVLEVFANGRQAVMRRIYPARTDSLGVSFFAEGGAAKVNVLEAWEISPSNPY
ncbi:MAG: glycoside hydrolase family 32 protein [Gammaproteobacteria bacterium TMED134]|nr:MAG: glycoside hydrolase family 32 protein [Gammaproteobacteria bacterium TMED134]